MNIKRVMAGLSAAAVAASMMATAAFADEAEPTIYGVAGISFQVRDSWEHRDNVSADLLNEKGDTPLDATCYDVNITGNGEYEVSLEGWWCGLNNGWERSLMGWIGLDTTIPVEETEDENGDKKIILAGYPDAEIKVTSYTEDGVEYDLTENTDIGMEDDGAGNAAVKLVNSWSNPMIDVRGEDFECKTWQTTDPLTIKFTVSGLPTEKDAEFVNEVIEYVSGKGAGAADEPEESEVPESSSGAESTPDSTADESSAAEDASSDDANDSATTGEPASSSASSDSDDESSNLPLYLGIGGGVVVLGAIVAIVIKAKK